MFPVAMPLALKIELNFLNICPKYRALFVVLRLDVQKRKRMAHHRRISPSSKINNDTGFGTSATSVGGRFVNKDGSFNMRKEGLPVWARYSIFHNMLNMPRWRFISIVIIFYLLVNVGFSVLYYYIGPEEFQGM